MIEKCLKWQEELCLGDRTNLYLVRLTNGRVYCYNRHDGWKYREDIEFHFMEGDRWKPCTPLEVVVLCGTKGLE